MTEEEKKIVPQIIIADLKYLSVRKLYLDWFFPSGAEIAVQLLDSTIRLFLKSISREDLVKEIRSWGGDESHNPVRIIEELRKNSLAQDFSLTDYNDALTRLHKLYKLRYWDSLSDVGSTETTLGDLDSIDYTYAYFRRLINISANAKKETLIDKALSQGMDLSWGEEKNSLRKILYTKNKHFLVEQSS